MFRPKGKEGEIQWVPIKQIFWTWDAGAEYSEAYKWQLLHSKVIPPSPEAEDTDTFPELEKNSADPKSYVAE